MSLNLYIGAMCRADLTYHPQKQIHVPARYAGYGKAVCFAPPNGILTVAPALFPNGDEIICVLPSVEVAYGVAAGYRTGMIDAGRNIDAGRGEE